MSRIIGVFAISMLCGLAMASGKPLAKIPKYDGKFAWFKLGVLPLDSSKNLTNAKSIILTVSFPRDVKLKADAGGNQWFTFVLADQGPDFKWHQTTSSPSLPVSRGVIRAGSYSVVLPASGIPKSVLGDRKQMMSIGPNTSGLASPTAFLVDRVSAR